MNKKGQTLIIFVILVPIIITMLAIVVDVGLLTNEYQKSRGIIDDGIRYYFEKEDINQMKQLLEMNGLDPQKVKISAQENQIQVDLEDEIDSLFGKIIHINQYKISIHRIGKKEGSKIILSKKEGNDR